jgi:hypothetical protein
MAGVEQVRLRQARDGVKAWNVWGPYLNHADGSACRLRLKSMVGLLPLGAVSMITPEVADRCPRLLDRVRIFSRRPELVCNLDNLIARFIQAFDSVTAEDVLEEGSSSLINKQPVAKTEALIPGEPVTMN